ncbi:unnamed protein product [Paramecium octaurelia]|uniref:Uncharacterized protein n=1 Tax=Paramecium octaurelia TaxID=43137 RepID=A0A8S1YM30_PAROT|nr:unnamed protein product [Paramecium octaurelia]
MRNKFTNQQQISYCIFFLNLVNYRQHVYKNKCDELQKQFSEVILHLKEIMIIKYQIETVFQILNLKKQNQILLICIFLNFQEGQKSEKTFSYSLEKTKPEEVRQLLEKINCDEFLLSVVEDFPKRITRENEALIQIELKNIQITKNEDFDQRLPKQKGILKYSYLNKIERFRVDLEGIWRIFQLRIFFIIIYGENQENFEDEELNSAEMILEQEKYEIFLSQLKQIEDFRKYLQIEEWNQLIKLLKILGVQTRKLQKCQLKQTSSNQEIQQANKKQIMKKIKQERDEIKDNQKFQQIGQIKMNDQQVGKVKMELSLDTSKQIEKYQKEYQREDENFYSYLESQETKLFKRVNDKEITQVEQDFLIQQIKKISLEEDSEEVDEEVESIEQFGFIDNLVQRSKDFTNNEQRKIKQGLAFTIIQISSNCLSESLTSFCQKVLIQLWVQEKDLRVRNILKNEKLISMQMQILSKGWQTQHNRIAGGNVGNVQQN